MAKLGRWNATAPCDVAGSGDPLAHELGLERDVAGRLQAVARCEQAERRPVGHLEVERRRPSVSSMFAWPCTCTKSLLGAPRLDGTGTSVSRTVPTAACGLLHVQAGVVVGRGDLGSSVVEQQGERVLRERPGLLVPRDLRVVEAVPEADQAILEALLLKTPRGRSMVTAGDESDDDRRPVDDVVVARGSLASCGRRVTPARRTARSPSTGYQRSANSPWGKESCRRWSVKKASARIVWITGALVAS